MLRPRSALPALLLAAFLLAGCGGSDSDVDVEAIEQQLSEQIAEQTGIGVASVDCPSDPPGGFGEEFACDVSLADGRTAPATVRQTIAFEFAIEGAPAGEGAATPPTDGTGAEPTPPDTGDQAPAPPQQEQQRDGELPPDAPAPEFDPTQ